MEAQLFLGFPLDPLFRDALNSANPHAIAHFIDASEHYLLKAQQDSLEYLGKVPTSPLTLPELELLEENIYSLLRKLIPNFPYEESSLYLFSLKKS